MSSCKAENGCARIQVFLCLPARLSMCVPAESFPLSSVEVDVLLLRLRAHLVDFILFHARPHHCCRVPVVPFQASAVLHHWRTGKLPSGQNLLHVSDYNLPGRKGAGRDSLCIC